MESPFQQRLQARGRRVGGVEQVVDLLAGGPQLENWGRGGGGVAEAAASSALGGRPGRQSPGVCLYPFGLGSVGANAPLLTAFFFLN